MKKNKKDMLIRDMKRKIIVVLKKTQDIYGEYGEFKTGWGNGYVILPAEHPCYGMHYSDIENKYNINVHGRLTYSDKIGPRWQIGFDTSHINDNEINCNLLYVENEASRLKEQMIDVYKKYLERK